MISREVHEEIIKQLKSAYEDRKKQLTKAFAQGLKIIDSPANIISKVEQILHSQMEESLADALQTCSELKAQLAICRMELQLAKKREKSDEIRKLKLENESLREQLREIKENSKEQSREHPKEHLASLKISEIVAREVQNKINLIEKDYILKEKHERIVAELKRKNHREDPEKDEKGSISQHNPLALNLSRQSNRSNRKTALSDANISFTRHLDGKIEGRLAMRQFGLGRQAESIHDSRQIHKMGWQDKQIDRQLDRQDSRPDLRPDSRYQKASSPDARQHRLDKCNSSHNLQRFLNSGMKYQNQQNHSPEKEVQAIFRKHNSPTGKFEQLQSSFAKELSELRFRMQEKRQKLCSPERKNEKVQSPQQYFRQRQERPETQLKPENALKKMRQHTRQEYLRQKAYLNK